MKPIYEYLFKKVLIFLGGISQEQWVKTKELVVKAATDLAHKPGAERRAYVVEELKKLWSNLQPFIINLLVDGAFGLVIKKL